MSLNSETFKNLCSLSILNIHDEINTIFCEALELIKNKGKIISLITKHSISAINLLKYLRKSIENEICLVMFPNEYSTVLAFLIQATRKQNIYNMVAICGAKGKFKNN